MSSDFPPAPALHTNAALDVAEWLRAVADYYDERYDDGRDDHCDAGGIEDALVAFVNANPTAKS